MGSIPDRGMRLNLPIAIVPLRRTDNGYWIFQLPTAYSGDEQMLLVLGRGHSVPMVTELIFVRAQCLNNCAIKATIQFDSSTRSLRDWLLTIGVRRIKRSTCSQKRSQAYCAVHDRSYLTCGLSEPVTVPWLPWIWRRDRVSLYFNWKTA